MMTDAPAPRPIGPLFLIGAAAGAMSGLFGIGGGVVMVPAMVAVAGIAQHRAHATSLAAMAPIAAVGAIVFGGASSVDLPAALVLMVASVAGVQVSTRLMGGVSDRRLAQLFGVFLVIVAVVLLLR